MPSWSYGDQGLQEQVNVGVAAVKGKAVVAVTCLVKNDAAAEDVRLSQHTFFHHDVSYRIGRSWSSVGTVHTYFLHLVVFPPYRFHMCHYY